MGTKKDCRALCTAVLFILLQLFKHQKAEGDGCGELRQSRKAGGTVAGRFPVIGGHGKQGFQLGGGHGDGSLHLTLINGAEARVLRPAAPEIVFLMIILSQISQ